MSQVTAVLLVVIAALGGFYGGFRYEKGAGAGSAAAASNSKSNTPVARPSPASGGGGVGAFVRGSTGTVSNLSDKGFTLTLANGGTVNVVYGDAAPGVRKTSEGSLADLHDGETVSVAGSRDATDNLTAQQITIVPSATPGG